MNNVYLFIKMYPIFISYIIMELEYIFIIYMYISINGRYLNKNF